jgi:type II secretory pathway pseudopilin PulG
MTTARNTPRLTGSKPESGFSLIELVVFIVVLSILGASLFASFSSALQLGAAGPTLNNARQLAQERMELILGQRHRLGFAGFTAASFDPCTSSPPSLQEACTAIPAGYAVSTSLTDNWGSDTNYKVIDVAVIGTGSTSLTALVANY